LGNEVEEEEEGGEWTLYQPTVNFFLTFSVN
jgi:hypothetical protein